MWGLLARFTAFAQPYAYFAIAAILATALGAAYLKGREDGRDSAQAHAMRESDLVATTRAIALRSAAEAIAQIQITHSTIRQAVEREIVEKPVYRDGCVHSDRVMQLINAALAGTNVAAADRELPGADAAHGK
jgi:hypothetical protein